MTSICSPRPGIFSTPANRSPCCATASKSPRRRAASKAAPPPRSRSARLDITQVGGKYVDQPVVLDGNLVSSRGWDDNHHLLREFIKMLAAAVR